MNIIKPVNEEKDHWVGFFFFGRKTHFSCSQSKRARVVLVISYIT